MGCGVSKFDGDVVGPTCKFRPLSSHIEKIVQQQQQQRGTSSEQVKGMENNLSFKHLLTGDGGDLINHGCKSVSSPPPARDADGFEKEGAVSLHDDDDDQNNAKVVGLLGDKREEKLSREEEEEVVDDDGKDELSAGLGSPSFREYWLIDDSHTRKDDGDVAKVQNKSPSRKRSIAHSNSSKLASANKERSSNGRNNVLHKGSPPSPKAVTNHSSSHDSPLKMAGKAGYAT